MHGSKFIGVQLGLASAACQRMQDCQEGKEGRSSRLAIFDNNRKGSKQGVKRCRQNSAVTYAFRTGTMDSKESLSVNDAFRLCVDDLCVGRR